MTVSSRDAQVQNHPWPERARGGLPVCVRQHDPGRWRRAGGRRALHHLHLRRAALRHVRQEDRLRQLGGEADRLQQLGGLWRRCSGVMGHTSRVSLA